MERGRGLWYTKVPLCFLEFSYISESRSIEVIIERKVKGLMCTIFVILFPIIVLLYCFSLGLSFASSTFQNIDFRQYIFTTGPH